MSALSLDSAKNIAIIVAVVMVVLAVLSAMIVKNIVGKIISIVLLAGLALGVWTQRTNLQNCADKAQAEIEAKGPNATLTCTFFGQEIKVP
jgi:protein-S-isoprenylcysteine O-methyltransferase Ste14